MVKHCILMLFVRIRYNSLTTLFESLREYIAFVCVISASMLFGIKQQL